MRSQTQSQIGKGLLEGRSAKFCAQHRITRTLRLTTFTKMLRTSQTRKPLGEMGTNNKKETDEKDFNRRCYKRKY